MPEPMTQAAIGGETAALLRDSARSFLAARHSPKRLRALRDSPLGYDRAVWREIAGLGWIAMRVPEAAGVPGLGLAEVASLCEELGAALLPEPLVAAGLMPANILQGAAPGALRDGLLRQVLAGEAIAPVAWQERADQLEPEPIGTILEERAADGAVLRGRKLFVPSAPGADGYIASCLVADGGFALAFVPADAAGVGVEPRRLVDGSLSGTVVFDGAPATVLARGPAARGLLQGAVEEATIALCAQQVGLARTALDTTVEYLKTRVQFGRPLASFQVLQHRLVDLSIEWRLAMACLRNALRLHEAPDAGAARARAVSAAKARSSNASVAITRAAIQLHGGIGFTDEADIGLYLKAALRLAGWLGSAPAHRARFGRLRDAGQREGHD